MDMNQIEAMVRASLAQASAGQEIERSKIDFKETWYNLKKDEEANEFVKDSSAIVNSYGPDGFIVIGFSISKKSYKPAKFKDCGLRDVSDLVDILSSRLSEPFSIDVIDEVLQPPFFRIN